MVDFNERRRKLVVKTLGFLQKSITVNNGAGSSAYFHPLSAWAAPYPETTGYIIETLWDYHQKFPDMELNKMARSCSEWLRTIQLENGAFPGGLYEDIVKQPIVFDTGQILFGITRSFLETGEKEYIHTARNAYNWLIQLWNLNGNWERYSYQDGYEPSYNARVLWSILWTSRALSFEPWEERHKVFAAYAKRVRKNGWVDQWSFRPGEAVFTHTIAYTWRGLLESALLLDATEKVIWSLNHIRQMINQAKERGRWAGRYFPGWRGDFSFLCVVGQAQLALLFWRCFEVSNDQFYALEARSCFQAIYTLPKKSYIRGGVPGSWPIWGPYQRFRYPNWAAKFYLDAAAIFLKA